MVSLDRACDTFLLLIDLPNLPLKVITGGGAMVSGVWLDVGSSCRAGEVWQVQERSLVRASLASGHLRTVLGVLFLTL